MTTSRRGHVSAFALAAILVARSASADDVPAEVATERLRGEIAVAASLERTERTWGGVEAIVVGAGLTAFSAYGYGEAVGTPTKTLAVVGIVLNGLTFLGGVAAVATGGRSGRLSTLERVDALDRVSTPEKRLEQLERGLHLAAEADLRARHKSGVSSLIVGAALLAGGVVYMAVDTDQTRTNRNVGGVTLGLLGAKYVFDGIGDLAWRRTPAELLHDAWIRGRGEPAPAPEITALQTHLLPLPTLKF